MGFKDISCRIYLKTEDFLRTRNFSASKSTIRLIISFLTNRNLKKLDAYAYYLVSNYNSRYQDKLINEALKIAGQYNREYLEKAANHEIIRSIIAKKPINKKERGVLIVSFESELSKLVHSNYFNQIEDKYQMVFIPTWQPFFSTPFFLMAAKSKKAFFIMPSAMHDMHLCHKVGKNCIPLPFHAASWVNEGFYSKESNVKDIDIIMVANFSKYKRHWRLFEALTELPKDISVYLAGVPIGKRTKEELIKEAGVFGVQDRIKILEKLSDREILEVMGRAKIFCALSHKEGSYIAVAESLMAGTPVGMYENAMIGTKSYINKDTGVLFSPKKKLAPQILDFLERSGSFRPNQWAESNISAISNAERLNGIFRDYSDKHGHEWSVDIEKFYCKHFDFFYYRGLEAENEFKDTYEEFREEFGLSIERPKLSTEDAKQ